MQIAHSTITLLLIFSTIYSYGLIVTNLVFKKQKIDIFIIIISGYTFIGVLTLIFHFFFKINDTYSVIIFIFGFIFFIFNFNFSKSKLKEFIFLSLIIVLLGFILFAYSDHPIDANMYHHPYISYLKSEKIIFGIANIQFRFGHISFLQYIQAALSNGLMHDISLASINIIFYITFIFYFSFEIFESKKFNFLLILKILLVSFVLIKFSRYREYGNDLIPLLVSIYFLIKIFDVNNLRLPNSKILFNLALPFAAFMFLHKISYLFVFLIFLPLIKYIKFRKIKKDDLKFFGIFVILILPWLAKNYINTSCLAYPIEITCFENSLFILNGLAEPSNAAWLTEIWAKGFIDNPNWEKLDLDVYRKNLNWLPTWLGGHFNKILEKISPLIFIQILMLFYLFLKKDEFIVFKKNRKISIFFLLIFVANFLGMLIWFLKAPTFRYGSFYIIAFITLLYILILGYFFKIKETNNFIFFKIIFLIALLFFIFKNLNRIYNSNKLFFPKTTKNITNYNFYNKNGLNLLSPINDVCYFTNLICSHEIPKEIKINKIGNYYIFN